MELTPAGTPVTPESQWARDPRWQDAAMLDLSTLTHLLVVSAHPDDETLGIGGLLASAPIDVAIDVVIATDGNASHPRSPTHSPTDLARIRRREVKTAVDLLAPHARLHLLDLPDGDLAAHQDALTAALVRLTQPGRTVLLAPYRHDGHPDHEAAARAAAAAAWRTDTRLLEYPIWLWHWQGPEDLPWPAVRRVDLRPEERDRKVCAIAAHHSQVTPLSAQPGDETLLPASMLAHFARRWETLLEAEPGEVSPFEQLHTEQADPWRVRTSWYERRKRTLTLGMLPHQRYTVALEVGCSVGALAEDLLARCESVVAVDESAAALARVAGTDRLRTARASLPEQWAHVEEHLPGELDLVILSEVGYFLSPGRLRRLAEQVAARLAGAPRATVLACHWRHEIVGWPLTGDTVHAALEEVLGAAGLRRHGHLVEDDVVLTTWCADVPGG